MIVCLVRTYFKTESRFFAPAVGIASMTLRTARFSTAGQIANNSFAIWRNSLSVSVSHSPGVLLGVLLLTESFRLLSNPRTRVSRAALRDSVIQSCPWRLSLGLTRKQTLPTRTIMVRASFWLQNSRKKEFCRNQRGFESGETTHCGRQ